MEQYATITEAPSRTILLHVVPVNVIAPSGSYGGEYWTKMELNKFISNPRDALYRTMWWHTQQNNKLLGGQIYHTRYIVLLYRTCPYIVPYAAISCLVLPNCHQCAAIECKSSHKIVPYAAISPSVCYIVSGVPRYANNHATTSSPMLLYRMQWRLKV